MRKLDMKEVRDIVYPLRNQPVPPSMRYSMKFYDNNDELMIAISDCTFISPVLDFDKLKSRFNNDFVKGKAKAVKITFTDYKSVSKTFICGFRGNPGKVVIIDTDNNLEMSVTQFSESLKVLENMLDCPDPIQYLEQ